MRKSHALLAAAVLMAAETALAASGAASGPQPGRELALIDVVVLCLAGSLVFFMQAGFAFLESGLSRAKNNVNVLMKNFLDCLLYTSDAADE